MRLYILILTITIEDTIFPKEKIIINIKMWEYWERGQGHDIVNCPSKNAHFCALKP